MIFVIEKLANFFEALLFLRLGPEKWLRRHGRKL